MTKRNKHFDLQINKKPRIEQNLDDLWDDADVDDCLIRATQLCEESVNESFNAIPPTYNEFKKPPSIFTSTQTPNNSQKDSNQTHDDLLKELQAKYEAKEGEATILRNQIKSIKCSLETEYNKKREELVEKVNTTTQELNAVKCDLEFKNLEIANLKQKIIEITKLNKLDSSFSSNHVLHSDNKERQEASTKEKAENAENCFLHPFVIPCYPFNGQNHFVNFGDSGKESYYTDVNNGLLSLHLILHSYDNRDKDFTNLRRISLDSELELSELYTQIYRLLNSSSEELNSEHNTPVIMKIVAVTYFFLESLSSFLEDLCKQIQTKNIRQADNLYLEGKLDNECHSVDLLSSNSLCDGEVGISARQSIALVAKLFPYNDFLRKHILENTFPNFEKLSDILKTTSEKCLRKKNYFFLQILHITRIIEKIRKDHVFPGFLLATIELLNIISVTNNFHYLSDILVNITQEIVFARPKLTVLRRLTFFIAEATKNLEFVNSLCKNPSEEHLKQNEKEGFWYFNSKACILQIFCVLVEGVLRKSEKIDVSLCSSIVKITANIHESNSSWIFYQENSHNDCLCRINRLFIRVIWLALQEIKNCPSQSISEYYKDHVTLIKIGLKVIHLLNFQSTSDLIVKYIGSYSQYKYAINVINNLQDVLDMTELEVELFESIKVSEEESDTIINKFENITLWETI